MKKPLPIVIAPTAIEFAAVRQAIWPWVKARKVNLAQCGMGNKRAHVFGEKLDSQQSSCLILLGWAGGLIPNLLAGDFICADSALYMDRVPVPCRQVHLSNVRQGPILTVPKALFTPQEKFQAQASGAIAVEMEAYPLAVKARQLGIPFIHTRIILDTLDESMPDFGSDILNDAGEMRLRPFLIKLFRKPGQLKILWQLNGRIRKLNPLLGNLALNICRLILADD
jgi:nucleoside phosphorylase